jgi:hypothetical protein
MSEIHKIIREEIKSGRVLLFKKFHFHFAKPSDKRTIVLNKMDAREEILYVPVHSRKYDFLYQLGCQDNCYMLDAKQDACFEKETWIDFNLIDLKSYESLYKDIINNNLTIKSCMDNKIFKFVLDCIKKSDIANYYKRLLP